MGIQKLSHRGLFASAVLEMTCTNMWRSILVQQRGLSFIGSHWIVFSFKGWYTGIFFYLMLLQPSKNPCLFHYLSFQNIPLCMLWGLWLSYFEVLCICSRVCHSDDLLFNPPFTFQHPQESAPAGKAPQGHQTPPWKRHTTALFPHSQPFYDGFSYLHTSCHWCSYSQSSSCGLSHP